MTVQEAMRALADGKVILAAPGGEVVETFHSETTFSVFRKRKRLFSVAGVEFCEATPQQIEEKLGKHRFEATEDPVNGQPFLLVKSRGWARRRFASEATKTYEARWYELSGLLDGMRFWKDAYRRDVVSRIFSLINQSRGLRKRKSKPTRPRRVDLGTELWAELDKAARARGETRRQYIEAAFKAREAS